MNGVVGGPHGHSPERSARILVAAVTWVVVVAAVTFVGGAAGERGEGGTGLARSQQSLITAGHGHTCVIRGDGLASCWGDNNTSALGDGTRRQRTLPVSLTRLSDVIEISGGDGHTCALRRDGSLRCWGWGGSGQLGDGTTARFRPYPVPVVKGITNAVGITAGGEYSCALLDDGTARCWGYNVTGELGDGTTTPRSTPVAVVGLDRAIAIAASDPDSFHGANTCALLTEGSVRCWGSNEYGQLGDGSTTDRATAGAVNGLSDAVAVAVGGHHACALLAGGTVQCWGANYRGQLGDGTTDHRVAPVAVGGLGHVISISAGKSHTCAVLADGTVRCWGANFYGQLGIEGFTEETVPVEVPGLSGVRALTTGDSHTCALVDDGTVWCWGNNYEGQLGDGTNSGRHVPTVVGGGLIVTPPSPLDQRIIFGNLADRALVQSSFTVEAAATSGLAVTFTSTTPTVCSSSDAAGSTITVVKIGTCTIVAHQPGDATFAAAPALKRSFKIVNRLSQKISFHGPGATPRALSPFTTAATARSGLPVTITSTKPDVCTASGAQGFTITLIKTGTCRLNASVPGDDIYAPASVDRQFAVVDKLSQTIEFSVPSFVGQTPPSTMNGIASSALPVFYTTSTPTICTATGSNGATIEKHRPGKCSVTAAQPGDAIYKPARPVTRSFEVL